MNKKIFKLGPEEVETRKSSMDRRTKNKKWKIDLNHKKEQLKLIENQNKILIENIEYQRKTLKWYKILVISTIILSSIGIIAIML